MEIFEIEVEYLHRTGAKVQFMCLELGKRVLFPCSQQLGKIEDKNSSQIIKFYVFVVTLH